MQHNDYIKSLKLEPHQEGGWFRQVYTSDKKFYDEDSNGNRFYYTSIYFLLDDTSCSHFHRLNHDEMWYYHDGEAITIHCIAPDGKYSAVKLGKMFLLENSCNSKFPNTLFLHQKLLNQTVFV